MKILKTTAVAILMASFASSAMAQDSNTYINVGIDTLEFDLYNLGGKVGYNFNENFGIEGQASFGISSKNDVKFDYVTGAFGVARFPAGEKVELFGRAGYYFAKASDTEFDISAKDDSFALGAGAQYFFTDRDGIRVEYTYLDGDGGNGDVFGVSYVRNF